MNLSAREPKIPLGTYWTWFIRRTLYLPLDAARVHMHVLGKTGSGKSYFLASLFLSLYLAGQPVTLIDPHGDLAQLVLTHLVAQGQLQTPKQRQRLIYLDIPAATAENRFLPFNFLAQPYDDHAMAEHVAEAARRAWPELAQGAPTFENILKHSVVALREAGLPLTRLSDLLTDTAYRHHLLQTPHPRSAGDPLLSSAYGPVGTGCTTDEGVHPQQGRPPHPLPRPAVRPRQRAQRPGLPPAHRLGDIPRRQPLLGLP